MDDLYALTDDELFDALDEQNEMIQFYLVHMQSLIDANNLLSARIVASLAEDDAEPTAHIVTQYNHELDVMGDRLEACSLIHDVAIRRKYDVLAEIRQRIRTA